MSELIKELKVRIGKITKELINTRYYYYNYFKNSKEIQEKLKNKLNDFDKDFVEKFNKKINYESDFEFVDSYYNSEDEGHFEFDITIDEVKDFKKFFPSLSNNLILIDNPDKKHPKKITLDREEIKLNKIYDEIKSNKIGTNTTSKMIITYYFTLFEEFLKTLVFYMYKSRPNMLKNKEKKFSSEIIMKFNSMDDFIESLIDQKVKRVGYNNIDQNCELFLKKFKIDIKKDFPRWEELREKYYRRNLIVHNQGEITEDYKKKIKKDLQNKEISPKYIENCYIEIDGLVQLLRYEVIQFLTIS